ncbi:hypothetical protein L6452_12872 [Arctium lappa]|uniref:Uncharacterized protein n=1 Tax=Arctium lappa TaxID=4217 RepID=A0ACB9CGM9_ARCLA|nr:hypothetical protein L6452_12872 [Arctium lappa]
MTLTGLRGISVIYNNYMLLPLLKFLVPVSPNRRRWPHLLPEDIILRRCFTSVTDHRLLPPSTSIGIYTTTFVS